MVGLGVGRAFELFKEIESKADQLKNPSGYLKKAASREGSGNGGGGGGAAAAAHGGGFAYPAAGSNDERTIHRRATWLNSNVFPDRPIDQDALGAMLGMGVSRALELFKEIEEKADQMKNPSGYLKKAAQREGLAPPGLAASPRGSAPSTRRPPAANSFPGSQAATTEDQKSTIHRRVTWLNSNVFQDRPIDNETIGAMMGMGVARALELFKEIEEKAVRNPNGYLQAAAVREGLAPPGLSPRGGPGAAGAGPRMSLPAPGDDERSKVHRRATWLNANVFVDRHIDQEAIGAMLGLGVPRALELFKEIEEKADTLRNPSGYLKAAAQREGYQGGGGAAPAMGRATNHAAMSEDERSTIHRRATWLNKNVFQDRPIDGDALGAMMGMGVARALELFKEIEEKGVRNPSGYLTTAAQREGYAPSGQSAQQVMRGGMQRQPLQPAMTEDERSTIHRRATWLNKNVFQDKQIDNDAIGAMLGLGVGRALELFKEIEEKAKAGQLKNPSGYLKKAAEREGLSPPAPAGARPAVMYNQPALTEQESSTIHRRVTWLNANVFSDRQIDQDAVAAMLGMGVARALELFKEIEAKANTLRNPSGYLMKAAANEGVSPQTAMFSSGMPAARQFDPVRGKADWDKIHRKVTWLNSNVFENSHIDPEAIEAVASLGVERAFEMLAEVEGKASEVKNPSGYLKAAARREWEGGPRGKKRPAPAGGGDGGSSSKRSKGPLMLV
eukprot:TRINITY_DN2155_c0_g1_i1.p1 TRINITY_DN2155_c0_g1~~TRINITY_DN2155_c0_g1_i1.p1  ORF type:complete len:806 (-),score=183.07 TRINITY_DN2155_c0_g1_i1:98-2284(-)